MEGPRVSGSGLVSFPFDVPDSERTTRRQARLRFFSDPPVTRRQARLSMASWTKRRSAELLPEMLITEQGDAFT